MDWTAEHDAAERFASSWMIENFGTDHLDRDMTAEEAGRLCVAWHEYRQSVEAN